MGKVYNQLSVFLIMAEADILTKVQDMILEGYESEKVDFLLGDVRNCRTSSACEDHFRIEKDDKASKEGIHFESFHTTIQVVESEKIQKEYLLDDDLDAYQDFDNLWKRIGSDFALLEKEKIVKMLTKNVAESISNGSSELKKETVQEARNIFDTYFTPDVIIMPRSQYYKLWEKEIIHDPNHPAFNLLKNITYYRGVISNGIKVLTSLSLTDSAILYKKGEIDIAKTGINFNISEDMVAKVVMKEWCSLAPVSDCVVEIKLSDES